MGISEAIGVGDPKKVTALEVWMFDKSDIRTVTKVLASGFAYQDPALRTKLAAKGEIVLAEPGAEVILETTTLVLRRRGSSIWNTELGNSPESFFQRISLELGVWFKEGEEGNPSSRRVCLPADSVSLIAKSTSEKTERGFRSGNLLQNPLFVLCRDLTTQRMRPLTSLLRLFFRLLYGPLCLDVRRRRLGGLPGKWRAWGATGSIPHPRRAGAGTGPWAGPPAPADGPPGSFRPVGLDLSPQMGALARRRAPPGRPLPPTGAGPGPAPPLRRRRLPGPRRHLPHGVHPGTPPPRRRPRACCAPAGAAVIVPVAVPGGRDPLARILRLLYRITGQDRFPPDDPFSAWRDAGFSLHTEWQPVGPDAVLLIQATRP